MTKEITPQEYWTQHTVERPNQFQSAKESLNWFYWRSLQYIGLLDLLPVNNVSDKVVLDYGCGPGHDLVGFSHFSLPKKLIGIDISSTAIEASKQRLALHNYNVDLILINEDEAILPLEDESVDVIHSSGVLHHVKDLNKVIKEFYRVLKPSGYCQIMVYNYDSIFMHLYIAYLKMIKEGLYKELTKTEAFSKLTDGPDCPISKCYKSQEFINEISKLDFNCEYLGAAIYAYEMIWMNKRYEALLNKELDLESRLFLHDLTIDHRGYPVYKNTIAGIDACYKLTKN